MFQPHYSAKCKKCSMREDCQPKLEAICRQLLRETFGKLPGRTFDEAAANTLYILTPDTYLFLQNETIAVKVGGVEKVRFHPYHQLHLLLLKCDVSTPLIGFCGERGISLVFLSEYGRFYGRPGAGFRQYSVAAEAICGAGGPRAAGPAGAKHIAGKIGQQQAVSNAPAPGASRTGRQRLPRPLSG